MGERHICDSGVKGFTLQFDHMVKRKENPLGKTRNSQKMGTKVDFEQQQMCSFKLGNAL